MMMIPYTLPLEHYLEIAPPTLGGSLDRTRVSVPILQMKKQVQVSSQSHVIGKSLSLDWNLSPLDPQPKLCPACCANPLPYWELCADTGHLEHAIAQPSLESSPS